MPQITTAEMRHRMAWCDKLIDKLDGGEAREDAVYEWIQLNTQLIREFQSNAETIFHMKGKNEYQDIAKLEVFGYSDGLYAYSVSVNAGMSGYGSGFHGQVRKTRNEAIEKAKADLKRWCEREVSSGNAEAGNVLKEISKINQQTLF